ncbi:sec14 cytosolic factor [Trifolium pratense]|uniref:Sec14 cytosolic factor n=1 Tax=Trifolium pratense TaxID=57577 RepID=A0A2K3P1Q9_TRIPR|nr:sec14 cytosolic factor [Trifolium pratense]
MGERVDKSNMSMSSNSKQNSVITGKKTYQNQLVASRPKGFAQRYCEPLVSLRDSDFGSSAVGRATFFLLKVAALETVRRFSKSRYPCLWRGLQGLQILAIPPFQYIQRWAAFRGLVKSMQVLSRPLLVLSIATVFTEELECSDGTSDHLTDSHDSEVSAAEPSPVQDNLNIRHSTKPKNFNPMIKPMNKVLVTIYLLFRISLSQPERAPEVLEYEKWLTQLNQELENQGISLPERIFITFNVITLFIPNSGIKYLCNGKFQNLGQRINDDELHRFYAASNNDFSCFLTSIKKTIRWRECYKILSVEELEMWSNMVFWHGSDLLHRPCLIVRLGMACSSLASQDKPRFAQAIVSQVEYGVLHLVDRENPQITVLVDCEGLSPLRIPMQILRSCSSILQDHFPNRLGCLFVIRLPAIARVIAQTFIQVIKPATKKKLKIEGEMYKKLLYDYLPTLPLYLGGRCTCEKCSKMVNRNMVQPHETGTSTSRIVREDDISDNEDSPSLHPSIVLDDSQNNSYDQLLRTAVISLLVFWVVVALGAGMYGPPGM